MKTFNSINEARKWFRSYKEISEKIPWFLEETDEKLKFGNWVLFQHIIFSNKKAYISRPILGIFVGYSIWDQAIVFNIIEQRRAWEFFVKILSNKELNIYMYPMEFDPEVQSFETWTSNIKILEYWNSKPTKNQLKSVLLKT